MEQNQEHGSEPCSEGLADVDVPSYPRPMCCVPAPLPATQRRSQLLVAPPQLLDTPSFYSKWIEKDLELWKGGITRVGGAGCGSCCWWQCRLLLLLLDYILKRKSCAPARHLPNSCLLFTPTPPGRTWLRALPSCTTCVTAT